jgi:lysophospholipase L1-like esterase
VIVNFFKRPPVQLGYLLRIAFKIILIFLGLHLPGNLYSQDPIKIVPLGNSITQANALSAGPNSYRRNLWNKLNNAGYNVDFVGSLHTAYEGYAFPDEGFDHDHEGHWGWRADQIVSDLASWLEGYTPDVALIHIGTNDAYQNNTVVSTIDEIEDIITILRNDNSVITIFLAQIIPLPADNHNDKVNEINSELINLASSMDQAQSRIMIVDHNSGWSITNHTYDNVHPNEAGEEIMAQRWFNAFDAFYSSNEPPEITGQKNLSVGEDTTLALAVSDFVIDDPDTDPANLLLTIEDGDHYTVSGTSLTPDLNWNGTLSVPVYVFDGNSKSNTFDASVIIHAVNDAPEITGQTIIYLNEDTSLDITVGHLTISDPDNSPEDMSVSLYEGANYTFSETTITPNANFNGPIILPLTIFDGEAASNLYNLFITVNPADDAPVISNCPLDINQDNDAGQCDAVVTWTEPSVTDDLTAPEDIVWYKSHSPLSVFPVGITTVTYEATDLEGNKAYCSFDVSVIYNDISAANAGTDQDLCGTHKTILSGTSPSVGTGTWTQQSGPGTIIFGDINVNNTTATSNNYGTYVLRWTITNGTCSWIDDVTITMNPQPEADAGPDQFVCSGELVTLTAAGGTHYAWSNGVSNGIPFMPVVSAEYIVYVTNVYGCSGQDSVLVNVNPIPQIPTIGLSSDTLFSDSESGNQWYVDGNRIVDAIRSYYVPKITGSYYSVVTQNGCDSEKSNTIYVNLTDIDSHLSLMPMVYPNPVEDILYIQYHKDIDVTLFGVEGRPLKSSRNREIDFSSFPPGIYLVSLRLEDQMMNFKIIKY